MVDVTARESAEILCCWLAMIGGSVSRRIRKGGSSGAWYNIPGGTAKIVISCILLRQWAQFRNTCSEDHDRLALTWDMTWI